MHQRLSLNCTPGYFNSKMGGVRQNCSLLTQASPPPLEKNSNTQMNALNLQIISGSAHQLRLDTVPKLFN